MFRTIHPADFVTTRWKNGGGITHEIARSEAADGSWRWRLSIAEVASDGPFSRFDGMSRILTVIEGAGLDLHSADGPMPARLHHPVRFSGDLAIESRLVHGPVRDFNVIHDPDQCAADVQLVTGPRILTAGPGVTGFLCLQGPVDGVPVGAFAIATKGALTLHDAALGLCVTLRDPR